MAFTHQVGLSITRQSLSLVSQNLDITGDLEINFQEAIPANQTDLQFVLGIDVSEVVLLVIRADQNMTIETNSGSAPDNTITLTANKPVIWYAGIGSSNPLTANVTSIFVTNTTAGNLYINVLVDN